MLGRRPLPHSTSCGLLRQREKSRFWWGLPDAPSWLLTRLRSRPKMAVVGFREWGLVMARRGHGARGAVALWMAALVVGGCGSAPASESGAQPTAHTTASEACRAGTGGDWKVAVEVDGPDSSALALVSGDSIATCLTSRNADRTGFGTTAVGVGLHPVGAASALTYVTSMATTSGPPSILLPKRSWRRHCCDESSTTSFPL